MGESRRADEEALAEFIEQTVGGRVTRVEQLARWRPAWDVDVELNGVVLPLHARGEREANFAIPCRIADEIPSHELLEAAGLPVPHVYGLCDQPYALVMDRLRGSVDLSFAADDGERRALLDEYLELTTRVYAIDLDAAAAAGFSCPRDAHGVALDHFSTYEAVHDALMPARDPLAAFLRRWLHRNFPPHRASARYITYDAFQFMFEDGRITGLLDFELAHVGDPLMDLAALRVRDTIKNVGDLAETARRWAEVTGEALDFDVIDYHTVMYNTLTVLSAGPPLAAPVATTDYMSHMAWWVNSARWALEVIADMQGIELAAVDDLPVELSGHSPAYRHLVSGLRARSVAAADDYELATQHKLARHLVRLDESGRAAAAADLDDLTELLGERPPSSSDREADQALLAFIDTAGPEHDEVLVRLLDRRAQRLHLLMAPAGSLMVRHPRLRGMRPGAQDARVNDEGWPPGAIPGTR